VLKVQVRHTLYVLYLNRAVLFCTVVYCNVLYIPILFCAVLYCTVRPSAIEGYCGARES